MKKIFVEYKMNKVRLRDLEYNIILKSRQESLGVHSFAVSDPVYSAVEKMEKLGKQLRRDIKIVEETQKKFHGTKQWNAVELLYFKKLDYKTACDFLFVKKTQLYKYINTVMEYAKGLMNEISE